jgi:superfamily II DNA or RNA helicase
MSVKLTLFDPLTIQIQTDDIDYLDMMRDEFTRYVSGFRFVPAYKSGAWNGKVSMIHEFRRTFPYGILLDYMRTHKRNFKRISLELDPKVTELFKGPDLNINYNLKYYPRPYQKDCIEAALTHTKGIIRSATASGKSLVIAYIIKALLENGLIKKALIIVPSTSLIRQFHDDLLDYGFVDDVIGEVYSDKKQWDRDIVISTWQSLKNNRKQIMPFGCVIVDETHGAKAHELKKLLASTPAKYRLGFTGTMPLNALDNWNTKAYLGPIIREYPSGLLAEQGYISKCTVNMFHINYKTDFETDDYHQLRDLIFSNPYRLKVLSTIANQLDHNVLFLVHKVEKEGEMLKDYFKKIRGKEVVFLSGKDSVERREKWRKACMKRKDLILIATYGIFQQGINIPNLKYVVLASPFKAKIRILQSIGRALRKHEDKAEGAKIYDIVDNIKPFKKYGVIRLRHYDSEGFDTKEHTFFES